MDERTQILKVDPSDLSKVMTGLQYLPITELLGVPEEVSSTAEKVAWQHYHAKTGAFFNVGDVILFGKYKNKKGKVLRFGKNDKGQPTVEIEPIPKGRKKNKTIGLMKIWSLTKKEEALAEKQRKDEKSKKASDWLTPEVLSVWHKTLQGLLKGLDMKDPDDRAIYRGKVIASMKQLQVSGIRELVKVLKVKAKGSGRVPLIRALAEAYIQGKRLPKKVAAAKTSKTAASVLNRYAERRQIGEVAVDSGQLFISDPAYLKYWDTGEHPEFDYQFASSTQQVHFSHGGNAAMNLRGWGGDGTFPVYQETNDQGLVTKVEIVFDDKTAASVLTRFLEGSFQEPGERTAAMSPEKMQKALEQLRKGTWSPLMASVGRTKEILDHLGGWSVEPFVGLVRYPGFSDTASATMTGSQAEVEAVHALAKKLEVSALPTNPKPDKLYTMKVEDVKDRGGSRDRFDVDFVVYIGSWGWKITSPGNRTLELLPASNSFERLYGWHNSNFVDLTKATKKLGKRVNKFIQLYDIPKFMKGTKLLEQVNEALGTDAHEVSKPRTRENTGSCPCCFRNIKLKSVSGQNHPKMVNHGFERPRWQRRHVGNCIGVGFPPFELSPEGTTHLRDTIVKPQLDEDEKFLRRLRAGEVTVLYIGRSQPKKAITPEHPQWDRYIRRRIEITENSVKELQSDFKILNGLITGWKLEPLPEVGDEMKIWK